MSVAEREFAAEKISPFRRGLGNALAGLDSLVDFIESHKDGDPNFDFWADELIGEISGIQRRVGQHCPEIVLFPVIREEEFETDEVSTKVGRSEASSVAVDEGGSLVVEVGRNATGLLESERSRSRRPVAARISSTQSVSDEAEIPSRTESLLAAPPVERSPRNSLANTNEKPFGDVTCPNETAEVVVFERKSVVRRKNGEVEEEQGELNLFALHLREMRDYRIDYGENKYLGARVFAGELSLAMLARIAELPQATDEQREEITEFLGKNPAKLLLEMWNGKIRETRKRLAKGEYKKEFFRQKDEELIWIIEQENLWLEQQLQETSVWQLIESRKKLGLMGVEAWGKLCEGNMGLAYEWAKKYHCPGLSFTDLESFGKEGLIKAAAKFDYRLGFQFSTLAVHWIRQAIDRGIVDTGALIRLPAHIRAKMNKYLKRAAERIQNQKLGDESDSAEWPEREERISAKAGTYGEIMRTQNPLSLDKPFADDDGNTLEAVVPGPGEDMDSEPNRKLLRERIDEVLNSLSGREKKVIILRFGLDNCGKGRTLEAVGDLFGVTRERIRQIEGKAMRKLQHPTRRKKLEGLLANL